MSVQVLTDDKTHKKIVQMPYEEYEEMLEKLEDAEAIAMVKARVTEGLELRKFDAFVDELRNTD